MALLVNLAAVLPQPTGISTYSLNLVKAFTALEVDMSEIDLVSPFAIPGYTWHPSPPDLTAEHGLRGHLKRLLWTQTQLPRVYQRLSAKLLFSPLPEAPLWSRCRSVVMVHDLIPLHFPRRGSPATLYNRHYIPAVLRQAEHILCNSVATAQDIVQFCGIPAEKITPILLAYDAAHFRSLTLPRRNYFLYLGRLAPYKNVARLIAAFAALPHYQDYELWLAGPPDNRYAPALQRQVNELGITAQVKCLNYIAYEELPVVLGQAIALVFPSLWEGFGLPALEAMACGTPVIASNLASLPEVTGDAAILIDPRDVGAIANAMHHLATDSHLWLQLQTASLLRASHFSWAKTAQATLTVLKQYL